MNLSKIIADMKEKNNKVHSMTATQKEKVWNVCMSYLDQSGQYHRVTKKYSTFIVDIIKK